MSDTYLRIAPTDPLFVPSRFAAENAIRVIETSVPRADKIEFETYPHPVFIDQGVNLEAVICPACGSRLSFYDGRDADELTSWWHAITDEISGKDMTTLSVNMPCCGGAVLFANLTFDWPAIVASCEICVLNPLMGRDDFDEDVRRRIETALGCSVREIWAHY